MAVDSPNYAAFIPDPLGQATKGSAYVNSLYDRARQTSDQRAQDTAGGQYASGDYSGASGTLARAGNIPAAAQVQQQGQQANSAGIQYLAKALPVFQKIVQAHASEGPQGQAAALTQAFDQIAPEAKQLTGISDQTLQALRQGFQSDPTGTLDRLNAMIPTEFKDLGGQGYQIQGNKATALPKYVTVGRDIVQVGGDQGNTQPTLPDASQGMAPPAVQAQAPQGAGILPGVTPSAVAQVESRGNPAAVSLAGATGTMQTMPGTLQDPGYGVPPAANNSPQEQTRVGQNYLQAMTQKYGPAIGLVAYNMGPGATDKWLASGADFAKLPDETQKYIGRVAIQEAMSRRGPQQAPQGGGEPQSATQAGGSRVVYHGQPEVTPIGQASSAARAAYPGAVAMKADGSPIYPPANISNAAGGADTLEPPDANSNSILAATGLPYAGFLTLTGQASKLPRDATTRRAAFKVAQDFANKRGVDVSSFGSQYDAYNKVLQNNIERFNQTRIMEGELQGTIANIKPVADAVGMGRVRIANVLEAAAGKEVNDPTAMQYSFQLQQLRAELAGYNGALQGRNGASLTQQDYQEAERVIKNGLSSGGAAGLEKAISAATGKMSNVLQSNIGRTNKAIWDLFGVGSQYQRLHPQQKTQGPAQSGGQNYSPAQKAAMSKYGL